MGKNATDECDLAAIEAQVNSSKEYFLATLADYKKYDGEQIIKQFLAPFQARSQVTRGIAQEAEQSIKRFNSVCASLTSYVNLGLMRMQSTVLGIQIYLMGAGLNKMGEPSHSPPDPMSILRAQMQKMDEAREAIEESGDWAKKAACHIGADIIRVQTMAGDLIRLRKITLRVFKEEHIGTSFRELLGQLQQRQYARTGSAILDAAEERIWELAKELGTFIAEKNPSVELFNLLRRLGKALRGKTPDTSSGGTELMNELVSQLRHESDVLVDVEKAYEDAMKRFDEVDAVIR